jgi:ADP-ribose pyrophosphatase
MPFDDEHCLKQYLALRKARPDWFSSVNPSNDGAIQIIASEIDFDAVRQEVIAHRRQSGLEVSDTRIGVLARDPYLMVIRDPVRFSDGSFGLYNRIVGGCCAAALPILGNQIVLIRVFRHGLRRWSIEFPRGGCEQGEAPCDTISREIKEEIGADVVSLVDLGEFTPGGSNLTIIARLFLAQIKDIGSMDVGEGISEILLLDVKKVEEMIQSDEIVDGFTMATFLRARLRGLV